MKNLASLLFVLLIGLFACTSDDDTPPEPTTQSTAVPLSDGQSVNISFTGEIDTLFYKVEVDAPAVVEVSVEGNPTGIRVELLSEDNVLQNVFGADYDIAYGPVAAGTYFVRLNDLLSSNSEQNFSLTYNLDKSDTYELNNTEETAAAIELNLPVNAYLRDGDDVDYFQFELTEPAFVEVVVDSFPKELEILRVELTSIISDLGYQGEFPVLAAGVLTAGKYQLRFSSSSGKSSKNPYAFQVNTEVVDGVVGNTTYNLATTLESGNEAKTLIEAEDKDKFFKLLTPTCGVIDVTINPVPNGRSLRVYLQDEEGQDVGDAGVSANGSEGESISLNYSATANGTYYLRIQESSGRTSSEPFTVSYNLDTSDEYECNDTPALADANDPLESGQEYEAYIRTGSDNDWYAFEMDSVGIVTVELQAPSDINRVYVSVFERANDDSQVDYTEVKGGQTGIVVAGPLSAGTHYLRFNSWTHDWQPSGEQSRNPYKFTLSLDYEEDEINNTFAQATDVTAIIDQGAKQGRIYPRNLSSYVYDIDVDYYKFTVQNTITLRISVTALNSDSYTYLRLYNQPNDNSESMIGRFDSNAFGNRQEMISRTYTFEPGEYYIKVENNETSADSYDLKIETVP